MGSNNSACIMENTNLLWLDLLRTSFLNKCLVSFCVNCWNAFSSMAVNILFFLSLCISILFKYWPLMYCIDLGFAYLLLNMCTCMKALFCCCSLMITFNLGIFPNSLRCLISVKDFFYALLTTSILYCFTVNIYNLIILVILLILTSIQNGCRCRF